MTIATNPMLMRAYTDEAASCGDQLVADMIVERARDAGLAGATVLRGRSGHDSGSEPSDRPPADVEIVDVSDMLFGFVRELASLEGIGLVTLERVEELEAREHEQMISHMTRRLAE